MHAWYQEHIKRILILFMCSWWYPWYLAKFGHLPNMTLMIPFFLSFHKIIKSLKTNTQNSSQCNSEMVLQSDLHIWTPLCCVLESMVWEVLDLLPHGDLVVALGACTSCHMICGFTRDGTTPPFSGWLSFERAGWWTAQSKKTLQYTQPII